MKLKFSINEPGFSIKTLKRKINISEAPIRVNSKPIFIEQTLIDNIKTENNF